MKVSILDISPDEEEEIIIKCHQIAGIGLWRKV